MSTFTTPKGTKIELLKLKGKDYMLAAHRILWFQEETPLYRTEIEFPILTDEACLAKVKVTTFKEDGSVLRRVEDVKMEHKAHFADYVEKATTGALSRAVTSLGFGTAFALADLDEGDRIIDSPQEKVVNLKAVDSPKSTTGSFNQDKKVDEDW